MPATNECTISDAQLWSWVDRDADELAPHLEECPRCRSRAALLRHDLERLSKLITSSLPERVGPYRVLRVLGEGGQGVVYEAEQQTPRRRVALKVLRGAPRPRDLRLFEREVESLARLTHPGIASIYDAGVTEDGRPYFAMELIDGRPLHLFVRDARPDLRSRLELFVGLCDAVAFAHQRGVIHRDLKPANILVVPEMAGTPPGPRACCRSSNPLDACGLRSKVLDFGLARAADSDVTFTGTLAGGGGVVGTLPYMSPEQAAGRNREVDTRSDVYSLGVILYELLTERLPYRVTGDLPDETLRAIREQPPERISAANRALRGDIETIVLKALEKSPERRYATVAMLAEDVRRYLHGEPILARPPSALYQFRKLVERHRVPCAFAASLMTAILIFACVAAWQAVRLAEERDAAVAARHDAQRAAASEKRAAEQALAAGERDASTRAFLEGLLVAGDPRWTDGEMSVRELLAEAVRRLEAAPPEDALLEADLRLLLGRTFVRYGIGNAADRQLREAQRLREAHCAGDDPAVAEAYEAVALLLYGEGDREEGERLYLRARDIRRARQGEQHPETLRTKMSLARLLHVMGRRESAESLLRDVLLARSEALGDGHPEIADVLDGLAALRAERGDATEAERLCRRSLAIRTAHFGHESKPAARSRLALAGVLLASRDFAGAATEYGEALDLFRTLPGERANVVLALVYLARVHRAAGNLADAIDFGREALATAQQAFPAWHYIPLSCHADLGELLFAAGQSEEAEVHFARAIEGYERLSDPSHANVRSLKRRIAALAKTSEKPGLPAIDAGAGRESARSAPIAPRQD